MASFHFLLHFSFLMSLLNPFHAQISHSTDQSVILPVTKDSATLQYVTTVYHGTPLVPLKLVVDLGGPLIWIDSASGYVSSSSRLISSCSVQCSTARAHNLGTEKSCSISGGACDLFTENSITRSGTKGEVVEDIVAIQSQNGLRFLFSCAPTSLRNGLASGAQGMLGLGRNLMAVPSQAAESYGFERKFVTCLSSSDGVVVFGSDSIFGAEISRSLSYTPLVANYGGSSQEYFINVKSIKINGKRLALNKERIGVAKISTVVPYTTMESSIYGTVIKAYLKAASAMNMTKVAPVAPFGLCFSSRGIVRTQLGPVVPSIDLVLQSEMVKWRIHGRNAMVPASDDVMCLGFLDGGFGAKNPIVIGGFQLEDTILEFNSATSMLGFSSSTLMGQKSCSNFMLKDSLF